MGNSTNSSLRKARNNKEDEFYTQISDIEKELSHYKNHFKGKTILCNCDDPRVSNFFKYFALNFNEFGLKKIISTCYKNQDVDLFTQNDCEKAVYIEYEGNLNDPTSTDFSTIQVKELKGDGDFRNAECVELLKQADIVVTNPPFSLFREYVAQLMKYDKKFLIIGNQNAITYKEIFPLIAANKLWLGYKAGDMAFKVPEYYESRATRYWEDENGQKWRSMGNVCWYTNLDIAKRHEDLILYKTYSHEEYPKYDNYDAINVDKVSDIPMDWDGVMGVPITFLDKYNPDQFEIVAFRKGNDGKDLVYSLSENNFASEASKIIADSDKPTATSRQRQADSDKPTATSRQAACQTVFQNPYSTTLYDQSLTEKISTDELQFATAIPGMIKNAEGKINGKITYARILIKRK